MNTLVKTPLAAALAILLTGCVTTEGKFNHLYAGDKCLTCINNPISGEPLNHDGPGVAPLGSDEAKADRDEEAAQVRALAAAEPQYDVNKRTFNAPKNVDIAYIRVKQEFNFYDLEQVRAEHGDSAWVVMKDPRFKYEALQGVFYKMRDYRRHASYYMADGSDPNRQDGLSRRDLRNVRVQDDISLTIDTEIEKRTDTTSQITVRYWLPEGTSKFNQDRIGEELQARIIKAIAG